jgi:2,6-dihydroxypyridine 3-monooxygenase
MPKALNDIIVIGGSHAGLFSAIALQNAGFRVRVFERAPEILRGTGAGIRVQPLLADILRREAGIDPEQFATHTRFDRHLAPRRDSAQNRIVFEQAEDGTFASWGSLYRALLNRFGAKNYFCGESCVGTAEVGDKVEVSFAGGRTEVADLVVFADGITSTGRSQLNPSARLQYAGYVAWRGLVAETELGAETRALLNEARIFVVPGLSHVILYPVPGEPGTDGALRSAQGGLRINAIWYRNVSAGAGLDNLMTDREGTQRPTSIRAGMLQQRHIEQFRRDVEAELPPAAVEVFARSEPFVTTINDVEPARMVFGRRVLVGDAAAATRPHVSASTARAMRAAWGLAAALRASGSANDIAAKLIAWEREHVAIAQEFTDRGRMIGRRLQVDGTYVPGAPELTQITMPVVR